MDKYCPKCKTNFTDSFDECVYCGSSLLVGTIYCNNECQNKERVDENILSMTDAEILDKYQLYRQQIEEQLGNLSDKEFIYGLKESQRNLLYNKASNKSGITKNIPKCPTCQSTNLHKISATSKVVNTALFGIFGTKRHKTFHCDDCSYEW